MAASVHNDPARSIEAIGDAVDNGSLYRGGRKQYGLLPKILSVFAAFLLWLYVFQAVEVEKQFKDVPVTIENFDADLDLDIASNFQNTVDVTLRGTNSVIASVTADDIRASVDMSGITQMGTYTLDVQYTFPKNVTVASVSAERLSVAIDKTVEASIPVETSLLYNFQSPYELGEMHWSPQTVTVRGPESDVNNIAKAVAEDNLGNIRNTVRASIALKLYDKNGYEVPTGYIILSEERALVEIPVNKTARVPVEADVRADESRFEVSVEPEIVYLKGSVNDVEALASIRTERLAVTTAGTYDLSLMLPDGVNAYTAFRAAELDKIDAVRVTVTEKELPAPEEETEDAG